MINRTTEPNIVEISKIQTPETKEIKLKNGTTLHLIKGGSQDIIKIDFIYKAGTYYQNKPVIASMCSAMLNEGCNKYNSQEIAEIFDFHGAYMNTSISHHRSTITLFCLNKDLEKLLEVVEDIIKNSTFPEKEFNTIRANRKNTFILELEKTASIARKTFLKSIFGENHSYSNIVEAEDFDKITRQELLEFYKTQYCPQNCDIIISGKFNDEHIDKINTHFGDEYCKDSKATKPVYCIRSEEKKKHFIEKKNAVQSSIRIGCTTINKTHKDFVALQVVNTILGGYFGSRLMSNIREDKGYTYGISSSISSLPDSGYFAIGTDVGNEVREATLVEIYKELEKLHKELVSEDELNLVKNYMTGELLRALDGPFSISELVNINLFYKFEEKQYQKNLDIIKNITPEEIQELAIKYIKKEELFEIVAGA